jgi:hypothetical protein
MLLATRPVRDALRAFQSAVFEAKKHEEVEVLHTQSKMMPPGFLDALVARGNAVAAYAQRREAVREMMSDEMRAESQPLGEPPGGIARTASPTMVLAERLDGIIEPRRRE